MTIHTLGLEMHSAVFAIRGHLTEAEAIRLARLVIEKIGMTYRYKTDDDKYKEIPPHIERFPVNTAGSGGAGESLFQPCFTLIQPLLESYTALVPGLIGIDTWHEHQHFFLIINSCRMFDVGRLRRRLKKMGWVVLDHTRMSCVSHRRRRPRWMFWKKESYG